MGKIVRPDPEEWLIFHEEEALHRLGKIIQRMRFLSIDDPFFERTKAIVEQAYHGDRVKLRGRDVEFQFEYDRGRVGLGPRFYLRDYGNQTLFNRNRDFFRRDWYLKGSFDTEEFVDSVVPIDCRLEDLTADLLLDAFRRMFIQEIMQL